MATNNKPKATEAAEEVSVKVEEKRPAPVAPPAESIYTAEELASNHKAFSAAREIVVIALRKAGKKTATFKEAKDIIEKFKNKEVK